MNADYVEPHENTSYAYGENLIEQNSAMLANNGACSLLMDHY